MKLLIDIPEHIYEHAKEGSEDSRDEFDAMRAIANGSQESRSEIPNTCGDAISRKYILDLIDTKGANLDDDLLIVEQWIQDAPSVNPHPIECGDAISREEVLDEIDRRFDLAKPFKQLIESMPSVTPQQKTGRWKFRVYDANHIGHYECSECYWNVLMNVSDYCPHCGAKMVEPQESEVQE